MSLNLAQRRYHQRLFPLAVAYVIVLVAVDLLVQRQWIPPGGLLYAAALAPALPVIGVIWLLGRYLVEESDEFLRQQQVKAMLFGMGLTLTVTTAWGFLSNFAGVRPMDLYLVFPLFCAGWGAATGVLKATAR